jgi:hypothetical protein
MFKQGKLESDSSVRSRSLDELKTKPLSVEVPDVHGSLRMAGVKDLNLDDELAEFTEGWLGEVAGVSKVRETAKQKRAAS